MDESSAPSPVYSDESRKLLRLFWPIILGQLAQIFIGVGDVVMAGLAGTRELSGVAMGASFFGPVTLFLTGLTMVVHPVVSQLRGAGKEQEIPGKVQVATIVCISAALLSGLVLSQLHRIFTLIPADREMLSIATGYLYAVSPALPAVVLISILRSYSESLGYALPTLIFGFISLSINLPLNYIFIFGKCGAPRLGGVGCGVASALTLYLTALLFLLYTQKARIYARVRLFRAWHPLKMQEALACLKLGGPLGLSSAAEILSYSIAVPVLSPFGPATVAAHTIAMNVTGVVFMVPLSLSIAATIRTGVSIGARSRKQAIQVGKSAALISFIFLVLIDSFLLPGRGMLTSLYTDDPAVSTLAATLLLFYSLCLLPDFVQCVSSGIIRGFKDTRTIFRVTIISYWLAAVPLGSALAWGLLFAPRLEACGIWIGYTLGITLAAVIYAIHVARLYRRELPPLQQQSRF